MFEDTALVCLREGYRLQWEPRQQSWVLLFPEGMVKLNESARLVLDHCAVPVNISNLIRQIQNLFPNEPVSDDIRDFVRAAYEQRWLRLC